MPFDRELREIVSTRGADFVRVMELAGLPSDQTRGYPRAVVVGLYLSKGLIETVLRDDGGDTWEFSEKEHRCDAIADWTCGWLTARGYAALSQSESSNVQYGAYQHDIRSSLLPHKTIARHGGLGWIGKNNLLHMEEAGSAVCVCTLLTDAPLYPDNAPPTEPLCGDCSICRDVCPTGALSGTRWSPGVARDTMLATAKCTCCLQCLAHCPHTQRAMGITACL